MFFNSNDYMQTQKNILTSLQLLKWKTKLYFIGLCCYYWITKFDVWRMICSYCCGWSNHYCLTFYFQLNFIYVFFYLPYKNIVELTSTDLHINYVDFAFYIIEKTWQLS